MKKSTLDIWKKLQKEGYFKNHPLYNDKRGIPHCIDLEDIKDKNIVEIGCGYGRETWYFAEVGKKVWAIDVENKLNRDICPYHLNVKFVLADAYKIEIPNAIDYVYALHVFQHLAPNQAKDYINTFYEKMNKYGKINIQFWLGSEKVIEENKEPKIQYSEQEIYDLMKKFKKEKTWILNKFDAKDNLQYTHFYYIGSKR